MDSYQAIYDAVRSRISGGNISEAVERAASQAFDLGNLRGLAIEQVFVVSNEMQRPSVLYRPALSADGDMWCALYGEDLQVGVAGFGETPAAAMAAFDETWLRGRTPTAIRLGRAPLPQTEQVPS